MQHALRGNSFLSHSPAFTNVCCVEFMRNFFDPRRRSRQSSHIRQCMAGISGFPVAWAKPLEDSTVQGGRVAIPPSSHRPCSLCYQRSQEDSKAVATALQCMACPMGVYLRYLGVPDVQEPSTGIGYDCNLQLLQCEICDANFFPTKVDAVISIAAVGSSKSGKCSVHAFFSDSVAGGYDSVCTPPMGRLRVKVISDHIMLLLEQSHQWAAI
jgi:hypothetical protein